MPCYTVQTATVQFGKNTDLALMAEALKSLGYGMVKVQNDRVYFYGGTFDKASGNLTWEGYVTVDVPAVKRAYSEAVICQTAKRNGWQLTWSTNASGNRQAEVIRASR